MFGLICRAIKNCRVFCVLDNRTREILLAFILANVATINDINDNDYQSVEEIHNYCLSTRICIYCWSAYRFNYFKEFRYYLHRVNHSIFLGS